MALYLSQLSSQGGVTCNKTATTSECVKINTFPLKIYLILGNQIMGGN